MTEHFMEVEYLTTEDLLSLTRDLGVGPVRDLGLLDSAAHRPTTSIFGRDAYESIDDKAAVLLESIVRNRALVDGNERLGWLAVAVFYGLNQLEFDAPDDDAYDLVMAVAAGQLSYRAIATQLGLWRVHAG
jgi:death-on-curing protein